MYWLPPSARSMHVAMRRNRTPANADLPPNPADAYCKEHPMITHAIVPSDQWSLARRALLSREKEFMKLRDELSQARRDLPWERVTASYTFEGGAGRETLAPRDHPAAQDHAAGDRRGRGGAGLRDRRFSGARAQDGERRAGRLPGGVYGGGVRVRAVVE